MCHDVVRQAGIEPASGQVVSDGLPLVAFVIAEIECATLFLIKGVLTFKCMRADSQNQRAIMSVIETPRDVPPECRPERRVYRTANRVHHLTVESLVGNGGRKTARDQY